MKTAAEGVGLKPQPRQAEPGRIRYEPIPCGMMPKNPSREPNRSRVIGRGWRDRLLNVQP